ncbi:integral membrane protein [Cladophialophora carrionii]|uniref:Integral membrane protein n=1 Tax=Cladophialophora carrionii TaxID=86049 RepID=A0A1C1C6A6_9EURO|nr:integral membrane protein [Cladophialophora carrionii]
MSQIPPEFLPHDSYVGEIYRVNISFICVNSVIIFVRLIVRAFMVKHVAVDDYLMVAAGLCADVFSALAIVGIRYGLGKHLYDLPQNSQLVDNTKNVIQASPVAVRLRVSANVQQTLWICQIMYATALMLVKISIVTSYLRVFPTTLFRRVMYALSASIIAVWICSILVTIFQCKPVRSAWDFTLARDCLNIVSFFYFTTAFSIFTDFLLCILPLPVFFRLNLPSRQKYIVSLLFAIGLFATVASALRISVLKSVNSLDVTMGSVSTMKWSVVEVGTGIICACIPTLKPLFKNFLPDKSSANRSRERSGPGRLEATGLNTPRLNTAHEERHELTKPTEGWTNFSRNTLTFKQGPMATTKNFI